MNAERIEQARRFGGELCDIDGCTELVTLEHVTAHLAATARKDNTMYDPANDLREAARLTPDDVLARAAKTLSATPLARQIARDELARRRKEANR
jgi:hypothetical protein